MCGIAGEVAFRGSLSLKDTEGMVSHLDHRGPDHSDVWRAESGNCALGHTRLAVLDPRPAGNQPMRDPATGNVLVFNGEIYNFKELRADLRKNGYEFHTDTDTEVLLSLYREHGPDCIERLNGMFAFALWDADQERLILARDRLGQKPLLYAPRDDGLVFGSELQAVATHPNVEREIDREALDLYLELQYVPAPWTIYEGVRKLRPSRYVVLDEDGAREERYWQLDFRAEGPEDEREALDGLESVLRGSVRRRMIADVPLGTTLSGGVDSSLVTAMMAEVSDDPVETFTVAFAEDDFDEREYAQAVAEEYGTNHHVLEADPDAEGILREMVRHHGEPFGDKGAVPAFAVSKLARRHVTVALTGDGGDEMMGGYPRYEYPDSWIKLLPRIERLRDPVRALGAVERLQPATDLPRQAARHLVGHYLHPEIKSLGPLGRGFWWGPLRRRLRGGEATGAVESLRRSRLREAMDQADQPIDRMLWLDAHMYLRDDGLPKMDIASMHTSLEARSPFLDHEVAEFCASLPAHLKVKNGTGKYLLKRLAERYVPSDLVRRPKQGFSIPVGKWLRGPLRSLVDETLRDPTLMAPLDPETVEETLDDFQSGEEEHASRIWVLLVYGLWRETVHLPGVEGA